MMMSSSLNIATFGRGRVRPDVDTRPDHFPRVVDEAVQAFQARDPDARVRMKWEGDTLTLQAFNPGGQRDFLAEADIQRDIEAGYRDSLSPPAPEEATPWAYTPDWDEPNLPVEYVVMNNRKSTVSP
ncbi:MAG: hypothetical protein AB7P76_00790 [Candidatus Melainabacteria bacterium]